MKVMNYGSLDASKRLASSGIVLETDFYWYNDLGEEDTLGHRSGGRGWYLCAKYFYHPRGMENYPAPSMAEVWRELPVKDMPYNTNPTDALIDLLIWLKGQKNDNQV